MNDLALGEGIEETSEEEDEESDDFDRKTPFESNKVETALTPTEINQIYTKPNREEQGSLLDNTRIGPRKFQSDKVLSYAKMDANIQYRLNMYRPKLDNIEERSEVKEAMTDSRIEITPIVEKASSYEKSKLQIQTDGLRHI